MEISLGQTASVVRQVADGDTAAAVGSGDLPVLGTPILLAWLEAATVAVSVTGPAEPAGTGESERDVVVGTTAGDVRSVAVMPTRRWSCIPTPQRLSCGGCW